MVRLREALRPLRIPVDILVATEEQVEAWGHLPGTVLHEAIREGKVVYGAGSSTIILDRLKQFLQCDDGVAL